MAKILSCPNCSNNKNLNTNDRITTCSRCGYSWVSVSNSNIKSSEIKVVMDSINHYKYTLDNYNGENNTFPFYAIDNHFIENKNSNKNRLLKIHHVDEDFINQAYVGVNKLKVSKRPRISYDDSVDLSMYKNPTERVISDRTNQEYEIARADKIIRDHHQPQNREHTFKERDKSLSEYAEKNPEDFFKEYEVVKINKDGSVEVQPRDTNHSFAEREAYNQREHADNIRNQVEPRTIERGFNYEKPVERMREIPNPFKIYNRPEEDYIEERDFHENQPSFANRNNLNLQPFENRDSQGGSFYEKSVAENVESNFQNEGFNSFNQQESQHAPRLREKSNPRLRERNSYKEEALDVVSKSEEPHFTYEEYQEKRAKNFSEAKEQQQARRTRLQTKSYAPKKLFKKYQKSEDKKYNRLADIKASAESTEVDTHEKSFNNLRDKEKFTRESLANNAVSKKLREEISNKKDKPFVENEYEYTYNRKSSDRETPPYEKQGQQARGFSNVDDVINTSQHFDENLLENRSVRGNIFGKNSSLSFFENLKINSDGTIKEDPLGLNQDYNEFFNNNENIQREKRFTFKQIINEIKKRINKDKLSFNLVVLIIVFGLFGMLSHIFTSDPNRLDEKEIRMDKEQVNQIPTIDANPRFKAARGESENLVLNPSLNGATQTGETVNNTTEEKSSQEILSEGKKNVASDLSLEELKQDKLLNNKDTEQNTAKSSSAFDKTLRYMGQKFNQFFSDINASVVSSKWTTVGSNKYFEINLDVSNKVANTSYKVKTIEIVLLDISGNVIGTREIYPDIVVRVKETINSTIRIPKAPPLTARAYVKIKEATAM
ncbi:MAG: hypothetical protein LBH40_05090 [Alphaproteobacteria bacterium]|jgi:hypothetical protein|nr:hypothetical protein [Alphaproteobacteria bacterium]